MSDSGGAKMQKNTATLIAGTIVAVAAAFAMYTLGTHSNPGGGIGINGSANSAAAGGQRLRALGRVAAAAGETLNETVHRRRMLLSNGPGRLASYSDPQTTTAKPGLREWPASDAPIIPVGDYGSVVHKPSPRVLLYVTTHYSEQHALFLKYCWKNVVARSPLLQDADVAVYLNPGDAGVRKEAMGVLGEVFKDNKLAVYVRDQIMSSRMDLTARPWKLKQMGAMLALWDAAESDWFNGYDWVIRVNPDVIIRDDSFLRDNMYDPSVSAMIINCHSPEDKVLVMTDFFMVRPESLRYDLLKGKGAETTFTNALRENVLEKERYLWIPGAHPKRNHCRAGYMQEYFETPIIHEHALHPDICSVPQTDLPMVEKAFPEGWPRFWNPSPGQSPAQ